MRTAFRAYRYNCTQYRHAEGGNPYQWHTEGRFQGITRRLEVPYVFFDNATGKPYLDVKRSFHTALKRAEVQKCTKCDYQKAKDRTLVRREIGKE